MSNFISLLRAILHALISRLRRAQQPADLSTLERMLGDPNQRSDDVRWPGVPPSVGCL